MTPLEKWTLWCWAIFWLVWIVAWTYQNPSQWEESANSRFRYSVLYWISFLLLFGSFARWSILSPILITLFPQPLGVVWAGFFLALIGLLFAIWSRLTLGRNWHASMDLKAGHELVTKGPYALVRHPIYSAMLLMYLGSLLVNGTLAALIGLVLMLWADMIRIASEEELMTRQFQDRYLAYAARVKRLVPFIF